MRAFVGVHACVCVHVDICTCSFRVTLPPAESTPSTLRATWAQCLRGGQLKREAASYHGYEKEGKEQLHGLAGK